MKYLLCAVYVLFSVSGLTLIKLGSTEAAGSSFLIPFIHMRITLLSLAGIFCYGISFCLYMGVVSKFDLGIIIPILGGIVNILILAVSWWILKENLTFNSVLGAIIIIVGIVVMNINRG